jgi:isocitrate dehydrogenase
MSENERAGQIIEWDLDGRPVVPDKPIISFIEGDGIGPDIWAAARPVFDAAVRQAYGGKRRIIWHELLAGEKAQKLHGSDTRLPERTLEDLALYGIGERFSLSKCGFEAKIGFVCMRAASVLFSRRSSTGSSP